MVEDIKKSPSQKVQEPTCPASSPLPGDAPPNPPMFCLEMGRTNTPAESNKPGSRKRRAKGKERGLKENHDQILEDDENVHRKEQDPSTQEDAVIRVSSTESPSDSPKMGVGRRTSILFKKAKNGTRLTKDKPVLLQNVSKAENYVLPEQTTPAKLLSAPPAPKSPPPSPHQLRSRGLSACSDGEGEKAHSSTEDNGTGISLLRRFTLVH